MEKLKNTFCRLCLSVTHDESSEIIEETTREALDVLLLKLNEEESSVAVICKDCSVKLFAAFKFKITCINTEDSIIPYVKFEREPIDIIKVYLKEKEYLDNISEDERICRLCLQRSCCEFTLIKDVEMAMVHKYIPEINFNYTKEPVICSLCLDLVKTYNSFLNNCLDLEESIKYISDDKDSVTLYVKNEEIKIKYENDDCWTDLCNNDEFVDIKIKQEDSQNSHHIKSEDLLDAQMYTHCTWNYETKSRDHFIPNQVKLKEPSEVQMHTCDMCDYKTKLKYNLIRHQLQHKSTSELQVHKCIKGDYETITQKSDLSRHRLTHKGPSKMRLYQCDTCSYESRSRSCLMVHLLKHKDIPEMYTCNVCDFKTKYKNNLSLHQLRHKDFSEVQTYMCDRCDFQTKRKYNIERHQLKHNNLPNTEMHECKICGFKTKYKFNLSRHRLHHKKQKKL